MTNAYQEHKNAQKYLRFLNSENGHIQKEILYNALKEALLPSQNQHILDAGCGDGWLAAQLSKDFTHIAGCDSSETLIEEARVNCPALDFSVADLAQGLPYPDGSFNAVILNMTAPDLDDLDPVLKNLAALLKTQGRLLLTIPNPYYTYPVAEWKRSLLDVILLRKPSLKIKRPYFAPTASKREFSRGSWIASNFYPLSAYVSAASAAGLKLEHLKELTSQTDSRKFNLSYQLFRYPLLLLLEFVKP